MKKLRWLAVLLASALALAACGQQGESLEDETVVSDILPSGESVVTVVDLGGFESFKTIEVVMYHASYVRGGKRYECTLAVSDGKQSGGVGVDCDSESLGGG